MMNSNIRTTTARNITLGLLIGYNTNYPSYYFYTKYQQAQKLLKDPQQASIDQTKSAGKVGKLIALPTDETPSFQRCRISRS